MVRRIIPRLSMEQNECLRFIIIYDIDQIQTNDNQTKSGIIDAFVESVENDTEPAVPGKSVLSAMKAIFGSLKSSELGRTVRVDEEELE